MVLKKHPKKSRGTTWDTPQGGSPTGMPLISLRDALEGSPVGNTVDALRETKVLLMNMLAGLPAGKADPMSVKLWGIVQGILQEILQGILRGILRGIVLGVLQGGPCGVSSG